MYRAFVFIAAIVALAVIGIVLDRTLPPQHLPWRPLDIHAPVGSATRAQLLKVSLSPSATCMTLARNSDILDSIPAEPKNTSSKCGWDVARYMMSSGDMDLSPGEASMQCPLTLGAHIWLQEVDKSARARLGSPVAKVLHAGTYSCRRQIGNGSGNWSEHAFSNAWDVTGFELEDGRTITVLYDWDGERPRREFLRDVRDKACRIFRVTLSPDYNDAHRDHFHLDMGPSSTCQ